MDNRGLPQQTSNFYCLPGRAGGTPVGISIVKADQKSRQRYLGGKVPFGFRVGDEGALVPDAAQQAAIDTVHRLRAEGTPMRAILATLDADGHHLSLGALHRLLHDLPAKMS
jgi:putative DNA-invertase from lambdoid prophage Rac